VGTSAGPGGTAARSGSAVSDDWTIGDDGLIAASLGRYDQADWVRQVEGL